MIKCVHATAVGCAVLGGIYKMRNGLGKCFMAFIEFNWCLSEMVHFKFINNIWFVWYFLQCVILEWHECQQM